MLHILLKYYNKTPLGAMLDMDKSMEIGVCSKDCPLVRAKGVQGKSDTEVHRVHNSNYEDISDNEVSDKRQPGQL